jgi:hypothetical protein
MDGTARAGPTLHQKFRTVHVNCQKVRREADLRRKKVRYEAKRQRMRHSSAIEQHLWSRHEPVRYRLTVTCPAVWHECATLRRQRSAVNVSRGSHLPRVAVQQPENTLRANSAYTQTRPPTSSRSRSSTLRCARYLGPALPVQTSLPHSESFQNATASPNRLQSELPSYECDNVCEALDSEELRTLGDPTGTTPPVPMPVQHSTVGAGPFNSLEIALDRSPIARPTPGPVGGANLQQRWCGPSAADSEWRGWTTLRCLPTGESWVPGVFGR